MAIFNGQKETVSPSSLKDLIAHSHVFLTGVTGFVGGALLQRILSIDPGPTKVYVLIRERHGEDSRKRLDQVLSTALFATLPAERLERVQVIVGECEVKSLGISAEDRQLLTSKCDLVFHSAALISFAAPYNRTIRINTYGTRSVLELAKNMPKIKAMVYVSTAFIRCDRSDTNGVLQEKIYHTPLHPVEYTDLLDQVPADEFERRIKMRIGTRFGNSYMISKIMAECLLEKERDKLPIAIVRPSIVSNSWKEPILGWLDNVNNGAVALLVIMSYGVYRSFVMGNEWMIDIIPVDMVASTVLAAALSVARDSSELQIYNCTSGSVNPITLRDWYSYGLKAARINPIESMVLYPNLKIGRSLLRHQARMLLFQIAPTYALVFVERFIGTKHGQELLSHQWKFYKGSAYMYSVYSTLWRFDRSKTNKLTEMLSIEEQVKHPMDPSLIDWEKYAESCVIGGREHCFHDPPIVTKNVTQKMTALKILWLSSPFIALITACLLLCFLGCSGNISLLTSLCIIAFLIWL